VIVGPVGVVETDSVPDVAEDFFIVNASAAAAPPVARAIQIHLLLFFFALGVVPPDDGFVDWDEAEALSPWVSVRTVRRIGAWPHTTVAVRTSRGLTLSVSGIFDTNAGDMNAPSVLRVAAIMEPGRFTKN
jgi:hypothetical protein